MAIPSIGTLILWVVIGLVAGFLASRVVTGRGKGLWLDMLIGILGAFFGGWLNGVVGSPIAGSLVGNILVAFIGAVILLVIWSLFFGRGRRSK